jgi:hypothetical protein
MSYYYSNYISDLAAHDLSKDLNQKLHKGRNLEKIYQSQRVKKKVKLDDDGYFKAFERTIQQLEEKLKYENSSHSMELEKFNGQCLPNYKNVILMESFANFPDLTPKQIIRLNLLINEANLENASFQIEYFYRIINNTYRFLEYPKGTFSHSDLLYINPLPST